MFWMKHNLYYGEHPLQHGYEWCKRLSEWEGFCALSSCNTLKGILIDANVTQHKGEGVFLLGITGEKLANPAWILPSFFSLCSCQ